MSQPCCVVPTVYLANCCIAEALIFTVPGLSLSTSSSEILTGHLTVFLLIKFR